MRKQTWVVGMVLVLTMAGCISAYAGSGPSGAAWDGADASWNGFLNGIVGFFNNVMPWNWGNWMGK